MRKISAATIALAAVAVPLAAPASADPVMANQVMSGMYSVHFTDGSLDDLTFKATSCGVGCSQVIFSNSSGQARFFADRWNVSFPPNPAAWRCPDGTVHGGFDRWDLDPATGVGMMVVARTDAACGFTAKSDPISHKFTVTRLSSQSSLQEPSILAPAVS
jgi:hypothetical protein